jgi:hypothetical protein
VPDSPIRSRLCPSAKAPQSHCRSPVDARASESRARRSWRKASAGPAAGPRASTAAAPAGSAARVGAFITSPGACCAAGRQKISSALRLSSVGEDEPAVDAECKPGSEKRIASSSGRASRSSGLTLVSLRGDDVHDLLAGSLARWHTFDARRTGYRLDRFDGNAR